MDDYSKEELLQAIKAEAKRNAKLKQELEEAKREKNKSLLKKLSEKISMRNFGQIITHVVIAVVRELISRGILS
ncbi:MAG: hypothetical protein AAF821_03450 [Cyanobacteria bacterium P01_D01_bin.156]